MGLAGFGPASRTPKARTHPSNLREWSRPSRSPTSRRDFLRIGREPSGCAPSFVRHDGPFAGVEKASVRHIARSGGVGTVQSDADASAPGDGCRTSITGGGPVRGRAPTAWTRAQDPDGGGASRRGTRSDPCEGPGPRRRTSRCDRTSSSSRAPDTSRKGRRGVPKSSSRHVDPWRHEPFGCMYGLSLDGSLRRDQAPAVGDVPSSCLRAGVRGPENKRAGMGGGNARRRARGES